MPAEFKLAELLPALLLSVCVDGAVGVVVVVWVFSKLMSEIEGVSSIRLDDDDAGKLDVNELVATLFASVAAVEDAEDEVAPFRFGIFFWFVLCLSL